MIEAPSPVISEYKTITKIPLATESLNGTLSRNIIQNQIP